MQRVCKGSKGVAFPDGRPCAEVEFRVVEFAYSMGLSVREGAVLLLAVGGGLERKEAAHRLRCSSSTIDTYWRRILRKTGLESPLHVVAALLAFTVTRSARLPRHVRGIVPVRPEEADFYRYLGAIHAETRGAEKLD
jgi:DNA-binding CsgD family transcriptional regulator